MRVLFRLWQQHSGEAKLIDLWLLAVVFISAVRFVRLAWRLYRRSGGSVLPDAVVRGAVDPDRLARSALANGLRYETVAHQSMDTDSSAQTIAGKGVFSTLRAAEDAFLHLSEECCADVKSAKRASVLILLLSFAIVSYGVYPAFNWFCGESNRTMSECLQLMALQQFYELGFGLLLCAMVYMVAGFFERVLDDRRASWKFFCARLKDETSVE
jgi:hypothetical protein